MNIILMSEPDIDKKWAFPTLKNILNKEDKVCVLAFTFFDDIKNSKDWDRQYKKGMGLEYRLITEMFKRYGIQEKQIEWINYFTDTIEQMIEKVQSSTILCIPGGAPDLCMKRIKEKKLKKVLKNYAGTIVGISAGAMVCLDKYHITPDYDYTEYKECTGLGYVSGFDIEAHYVGSKEQMESIDKRKVSIYAIRDNGGMLVNETITCFGNVEIFE
ncbi:MAG: Type 1 glutamine amidotransferase-like domain-containing protein [Bacillota bacterium]|nr:Type 1 glutamine amidotransferase-like domain-containing protein [Bacillota bacterium]